MQITTFYFTTYSKQLDVFGQFEHVNQTKYISIFRANSRKECVNGNKIERQKYIQVLLDTFIAKYVRKTIFAENRWKSSTKTIYARLEFFIIEPRFFIIIIMLYPTIIHKVFETKF